MNADGTGDPAADRPRGTSAPSLRGRRTARRSPSRATLRRRTYEIYTIRRRRNGPRQVTRSDDRRDPARLVARRRGSPSPRDGAIWIDAAARRRSSPPGKDNDSEPGLAARRRRSRIGAHGDGRPRSARSTRRGSEYAFLRDRRARARRRRGPRRRRDLGRAARRAGRHAGGGRSGGRCRRRRARVRRATAAPPSARWARARPLSCGGSTPRDGSTGSSGRAAPATRRSSTQAMRALPVGVPEADGLDAWRPGTPARTSAPSTSR